MSKLIALFAAFGLLLTVQVSTSGVSVVDAAAQCRAVPMAADCVARNNLSEVADKFISRCRKGSIRREFPSEYLNKTLNDIHRDSSSTAKKAWKLLNDNRFKK